MSHYERKNFTLPQRLVYTATIHFYNEFHPCMMTNVWLYCCDKNLVLGTFICVDTTFWPTVYQAPPHETNDFHLYTMSSICLECFDHYLCKISDFSNKPLTGAVFIKGSPMKQMNITLLWWQMYDYSAVINFYFKKTNFTDSHFRILCFKGPPIWNKPALAWDHGKLEYSRCIWGRITRSQEKSNKSQIKNLKNLKILFFC